MHQAPRASVAGVLFRRCSVYVQFRAARRRRELKPAECPALQDIDCQFRRLARGLNVFTPAPHPPKQQNAAVTAPPPKPTHQKFKQGSLDVIDQLGRLVLTKLN